MHRNRTLVTPRRARCQGHIGPFPDSLQISLASRRTTSRDGLRSQRRRCFTGRRHMDVPIATGSRTYFAFGPRKRTIFQRSVPASNKADAECFLASERVLEARLHLQRPFSAYATPELSGPLKLGRSTRRGAPFGGGSYHWRGLRLAVTSECSVMMRSNSITCGGNVAARCITGTVGS